MHRFLLKLSRRRPLDRDLEAELAFHREMAEAAGNPIPLGNTSRIKEASGALWHFTSLENLWRDFVHGARGLRRNPALVITAVLSLALGIGANTAIFSLAVQFLLSQPSVTDPKSIVWSYRPSRQRSFLRTWGRYAARFQLTRSLPCITNSTAARALRRPPAYACGMSLTTARCG